MTTAQLSFLGFLIVVQGVLFFKSLHECKNKHNAFGLTRLLSPLGMFVWGDVLVLSVFWMIVALVTLVLQDWILFLLLVAVFWLVRSLGETMYWFLQQFAETKRDPAENLRGYHLVKNESIWFIYQVMWQCLTVGSAVLTVYLSTIWIRSF